MKRRTSGEIHPQLATLVDSPPQGPQWLHEPKFDGWRIFARKDGGSIRLITRNNLDWTDRFGVIQEALKKIKARSFILDGELVGINKEGKIAFQALQQFQKFPETIPLHYYIFDLLYLNGKVLTGEPLMTRREMLRAAVQNTKCITLAPQIKQPHDKLLTWAAKNGHEGVVSKDLTAPYTFGRSHYWLKCKSTGREEFLIIGFTKHSKQPNSIGALLIGLRHRDEIIYCGKVGTGYSSDDRRGLFALLEPLRAEIEIVNRESLPRRRCMVKPKLICEISFAEWTDDNMLRQPVFLGLRKDKRVNEVRLTTSSHPIAPQFM